MREILCFFALTSFLHTIPIKDKHTCFCVDWGEGYTSCETSLATESVADVSPLKPQSQISVIPKDLAFSLVRACFSDRMHHEVPNPTMAYNSLFSCEHLSYEVFYREVHIFAGFGHAQQSHKPHY